MAKLYFKHGTMNSSKSAQLIMTAHNYMSQGKDIIVLKPSRDTRWEQDKVVSRAIEYKLPCHLINENESITEKIELIAYEQGIEQVHAVLVDESQFLKHSHVEELARLADDFNIPVICFGLKNSYVQGKLFEGSQALLYFADRIDEIKTVCQYCEKKATMNLRVVNGKAVYDGETIVVGDVGSKEDEFYVQVCREHYFNPPDFSRL